MARLERAQPQDRSGDVVELAHLRDTCGALDGEVARRLHCQLRLGGTHAGLIQPHGEVGADPGMSVQDAAQRDPGPGFRIVEIFIRNTPFPGLSAARTL